MIKATTKVKGRARVVGLVADSCLAKSGSNSLRSQVQGR